MSVRPQDGANSEPPSGPWVLAVGAQNDFAHIYPNQAALLADHDNGAGVGERPIALEFFDGDGRRLAGVYDRAWQLLRLVPTADPPNRELVHQRVQRVLEYMRSFIQARPDVISLYGLTQDEALAAFASSRTVRDDPQSVFGAGGSEDDVFAVGALGDDDDRGIWHNLTHHGHP
jgi:hypothetical protein